MEGKNIWLTSVEVLNLIYPPFFFPTNAFGHQPTTFQFFLPLTPLTFVLVATAILCMVSEYASQKNAMVVSFQNEYSGKLCSTPVIAFTPNATAFIIRDISVRLYTLPSVQLF